MLENDKTLSHNKWRQVSERIIQQEGIRCWTIDKVYYILLDVYRKEVTGRSKKELNDLLLKKAFLVSSGHQLFVFSKNEGEELNTFHFDPVLDTYEPNVHDRTGKPIVNNDHEVDQWYKTLIAVNE